MSSIAQSHRPYNAWRTGALLLMGAASIGLALIPFGADTARKFWTSAILLPGGLWLWVCALNRPFQLSARNWIWLVGGMLAGVLISLIIVRDFGGGDYWHTWRGFPYRWLTGWSNDGIFWGWSPYPQGLVIDSLYWFDCSVLALFVYRQAGLFWHRIKAQD